MISVFSNVSGDEGILCNSISLGFSSLMFPMFKPYTYGDDVSKISEIFDIWPAFSSRTHLLPDVPAAVFGGCGGWFFCLQTPVFCGIFSENLRPQ